MNDERQDNRKLWNGNKRRVNLLASIYGRKKSICISKDVLRVIGAPTHVCFKITQDMDSFVIIPCSEKEPMSFRVPDNILFDKHKQMKVTSQSFVVDLLAMNDLDFNRTYRIWGAYSEKNNAVVFNMADVQIYGKNDNDNIL